MQGGYNGDLLPLFFVGPSRIVHVPDMLSIPRSEIGTNRYAERKVPRTPGGSARIGTGNTPERLLSGPQLSIISG